jgi:TonB family protein
MTKTFLRICLAGGLVLAAASARAQVVNPKPISTPTPGYPESLTDTGMSGRAEVDITIKTDGTVADPELGMAELRAFGKAAMAAVKTWKFEPASRDGTPVEMRVTIPFIFTAPVSQQVNSIVKRKAFVPPPDGVLSLKDYGAKLKLKKEFTDLYARPVDGKDVDESVQVDFLVAPDGTTLNPTIVGTPSKELELGALVAVARAVYAPPLKNGQGVYVQNTVKLHFTSDRMAARGGFGGGGMGGGSRSGGGMGGSGGGGMGGRGGGGGM